jgi:hypothetical protein
VGAVWCSEERASFMKQIQYSVVSLLIKNRKSSQNLYHYCLIFAMRKNCNVSLWNLVCLMMQTKTESVLKA